MNNALLSNDELKTKLNAKQDAQVIKWLNKRGIPWDRDAKNHPITTLSAIDKHINKESAEKVDF